MNVDALHRVSLVVPVYRGETTLPTIVREVVPLTAEQRTPGGRRFVVSEMLLVHDCGPDGSDRAIEALAAQYPFVRPIWLTRNYGQHAATLAGMAGAVGDWVVTIDEDGQHDPADIATMLDHGITGQLQLVYAQPINPPPHGWLRNAFSRLAKSITSRVLGNDRIGRFNSFRLVDGEIARTLAGYCGNGVYLDVGLFWITERIGHAPIRMRSEMDRPSGYSYLRLLGHFWNLILTTGTRPLRLITLMGMGSVVLATLLGLYALYGHFTGQIPVKGWASLLIVVAFFSGSILMALGVIAEYLAVTMGIVMGKPSYVVGTRPTRSVASGDAVRSGALRLDLPATTATTMRRNAVLRPVAPQDARVRRTRLASTLVLAVLPCLWHVRTTREVSVEALLLLVAVVLACVALGSTFARWTRGLVPHTPGIAYEALVGFFLGNTLLFALTLASPLGIGWHLVFVGVLAVVAALSPAGSGIDVPRRSQEAEVASLVTILLSGLFATLWTGDQQPLVAAADGQEVYRVWLDVFIHVREISAFAQSHGLSTLSDIKLADVPAPAYHFASYMIPAALDALTGTSAMDAYAAFQLPFGLLLTGLAAYTLTTFAFRTSWPAVVAVAVVALPDAYQQGFGLHYLSYHFMSQVNLGMLYGIACTGLAWVFMIEACRRDRPGGVVLAYVFLAVCVGYKAHLFVANAALLLIYPCLFLERFPRAWRVLAAGVLGAVFVAFVMLSQASPRVPTLRLDGSGLAGYVDLLMGGFSRGRFRAVFEWLYDGNRRPRIVGVALSAALILLTSFGAWLAIAPAALWWQRRMIDVRVLAFIALVFVNYLVMSMGLALDERGVGSPEELLNRPHAWAYFVVVTSALASLAMIAWGRDRTPSRRAVGAMAIACCVLVAFVHLKAKNLQTMPEWGAHDRYEDFNAVPACLVRSAHYVRDHGRIGELMQDSRLDAKLAVTALAERQMFVSKAAFGGHQDLAAERIATFESAMATRDERSLVAWLHTHRIRWFVLHPADADGWDRAFLDKAVFACDGYRVFNVAR